MVGGQGWEGLGSPSCTRWAWDAAAQVAAGEGSQATRASAHTSRGVGGRLGHQSGSVLLCCPGCQGPEGNGQRALSA